jgi:uncharacterized protein (UPF0335 family)
MTDRTDEASRLGALLGEIERLEQTRAALLKRVERARSILVDAGNRTAAMHASVDLLCDHLSDSVTAAEEVSMLEREIRDVEGGLEQTVAEASGLVFETESLQQTLSEADEELERLSLILIERKGKHSRGH